MVSNTKAVEEVYTDDEFWREMEIELAARLGAVTRKLVLEGARAAESVGVIVDFDAIHEEALAVTRTTESMYWGKMTQTTREGLRQALLTWQEQGLGKRGLPDLIDAIEPLFGPERAERIAVTEATRLFAEGNRIAAYMDPNVGGLEWQSAADEKVCAICGPKTIDHPQGRDHLIYPVGGAPNCPAHVRCRCALVPVSQRYVEAHPSRWQGGT